MAKERLGPIVRKLRVALHEALATVARLTTERDRANGEARDVSGKHQTVRDLVFREICHALNGRTLEGESITDTFDRILAEHDAALAANEAMMVASRDTRAELAKVERERAELDALREDAAERIGKLMRRNRNMRLALKDLNKLQRAKAEAIRAIWHVPGAQKADYLLEAKGKLTQRNNELRKALALPNDFRGEWPEMLTEVFRLRMLAAKAATEAEPAGAERAIVVRSVWRFNDHLPGDNAMRTVTAYVPRETLTTSRDDMAYGGWDWRDREEEFRARHTWVRDPPSPPATSGETEK